MRHRASLRPSVQLRSQYIRRLLLLRMGLPWELRMQNGSYKASCKARAYAE